MVISPMHSAPKNLNDSAARNAADIGLTSLPLGNVRRKPGTT